MIYVLKNALTRRMFLLFLALALAPTLLVMVVPAVLRVQQEQQAVRTLETDLKQKAESIFTGLVANKATHYEQVLEPRVRALELLANTVAQSEGGEAPAIIPLLDWIMTDDSVRAAFVYKETAHLQRPFGRVLTTPPNELWSEAAKGPGTIWKLSFLAEGPTLTMALPTHTREQISVVGIELWLDKIVDQVPRYGIADQATLALVSADHRLIALPHWGQDPVHLAKFSASPAVLVGQPLQNVFNLPSTSLVVSRVQSPKSNPVVVALSLNNEPYYLAFQTIGTTPLQVMLILPLTEVFNRATFYGAALKFTSLPIVTQVLISGIGFVLVIAFGALLTLREVAIPVRELARGAYAIADGNLGYRVPVLGRDEIRDLAQSFNTMGEAIQRNQSDLAHALAARQAEFRVMDDIAGLANLATDLPDKLDSTLAIVIRALDMQTGAVFLLDDENKPIRATHHLTQDAARPDLRLRTQDLEETLVVRVLNARFRVMLDHFLLASPDELARPFAMEGSAVAVPIQFRERIVGVMVLLNETPGGFSAQTLTFLDALATHIAILIENARLQSQARYVVIAEERRRLARELHDSVTQSIFSLSLAAEGAQVTLGSHPALDFLVAQAKRVRQEMRGLINELRPIDLDAQMLDEALECHTVSLKRATGLEVKTHLEGNLRNVPLPIQHNLNRILQEALSNVSRHAHAQCVNVVLIAEDRAISLHIRDDGQGFNLHGEPKEQLGSMGLISMRERAEMLGGSFTITSTPGAGTQIAVHIPVPPEPVEVARG